MSDAADLGYEYRVRKSGEVAISRAGSVVTTLRSRKAKQFLERIDSGGDVQQIMARVTGNYRRGNERRSR